MPKKEIIRTEAAAIPAGPYSQATTFGQFVFTAGQIALDTNGKLVGEGDVGKQTEQVLENIKAILAAADATMDDVLKTTVFITKLEYFQAMNEVYVHYFPDNRPSRSTVVAQLMNSDWCVEIEAVAARKQ